MNRRRSSLRKVSSRSCGRFFRGGGAWLTVIATHSPILLGVPDAQILLLGKGPLRECRYEDTGSYQIMRLFMQNRERLLHELLSAEDGTV